MLRALLLLLTAAPSLCWRLPLRRDVRRASSPRLSAAEPLPEGNEALLAAVRGGASSGPAAESLELLRQVSAENEALRARVVELEEAASRTEGLCEVLDDGGGWTSSLRSRAVRVMTDGSRDPQRTPRALLLSRPAACALLIACRSRGCSGCSSASPSPPSSSPTMSSCCRRTRRSSTS